MLIHNVLFKCKEGTSQYDKDEFYKNLEALKDLPTVRSFKIGKPTHISQARAKGYDFGIIVEFDSQADYEAYEKDDRHMTVANDYVWKLCNKPEIIVLDFEWPIT